MNIIQNIVPSSSPRKQILPHGIVFRFGYRQIKGTDSSEVGEWFCASLPTLEEVKLAHKTYCAEQKIREKFVPEDYGY